MAEEKKTKKASGSGESSRGKLLAKKDHVLHQNEFHFELIKGEPIPAEVPEHLLVALRSEGVID